MVKPTKCRGGRDHGPTQGKLRLDPISITGPERIASPVRIRRTQFSNAFSLFGFERWDVRKAINPSRLMAVLTSFELNTGLAAPNPDFDSRCGSKPRTAL